MISDTPCRCGHSYLGHCSPETASTGPCMEIIEPCGLEEQQVYCMCGEYVPTAKA